MLNVTSHVVEKKYSFHPHDWYLKIVLRHLTDNDVTPFVTHMINLQTKSYCHGHYFKSFDDAVADFNDRGKIKTDVTWESLEGIS